MEQRHVVSVGLVRGIHKYNVRVASHQLHLFLRGKKEAPKSPINLHVLGDPALVEFVEECLQWRSAIEGCFGEWPHEYVSDSNQLWSDRGSGL